MRRIGPVALAASLCFVTAAAAQEPRQAGAPMATAEAAVGTAIAERMLTGAAESFPAGTEKVYCFTRITNAADSEIEHVWYKGDVEMSRTSLKIGGSPWRTYSYKTIPADGAGEWRCDVMHGGAVIQSVKFRIQ